MRFALALLLVLTASAGARGQSVERIDPPHWWTGFEAAGVQLLVYGQEAGRLEASIADPRVRLVRAETAENANYLFLELEIAQGAGPGPVVLSFTAPDGSTLERSWELKARAPGSAAREGFDSTDTVYLLYPDRFANGDPSNDTVAGYVDGLDRDDPGGRHGGDIQGIIDRLGYVEAMGFTQLWLNPVLENAEARNSYHGYAITDHYRVDPRLGTNALYAELSRLARERGIGLIKDVVLNHAGSNHFLFTDPPSLSWFNNRGVFTPSTHQHTTIHDPYAAEADRADFVEGWFAPTMPDFDHSEPRLTRYLIENTIWWIEEAGLSGLRLDTYAFSDGAFLEDFLDRILAEYPDLGIVGEEWALDPAVIAPFQSGSPVAPDGQTGVGSLMDFPLQWRLREALREEDGWDSGLITLYQFMINDRLYGDANALMVFADNHDFDRIHTQLGEDEALTKMALAVLLTTRGIPQILYGTELLFTNATPGDHGEIRADFPGGWAGDAADAFTGEGLAREAAAMQDWLRRLLTWRRTARAVHSGDLIHFAPLERHGTQAVYVYARRLHEEGVLVAINKAGTDHTLDPQRYREALAGYTRAVDVITGAPVDLAAPLAVPARSVLILDLAR